MSDMWTHEIFHQFEIATNFKCAVDIYEIE